MSGLLEPTTRVNVTVPISGRVLVRRFAPGDAVKVGDVLGTVSEHVAKVPHRASPTAEVKRTG